MFQCCCYKFLKRSSLGDPNEFLLEEAALVLKEFKGQIVEQVDKGGQVFIKHGGYSHIFCNFSETLKNSNPLLLTPFIGF